MCIPAAALFWVSLATTAAAGAMEAKGQRETGKANAQLAANNETLAKQQAKDALTLGVRQQQESAWRTRALIGKQKVAAAANGLDMDVGTPLDIMGETAAFGQADEDAIGMQAARTAWGHDAEALNFNNQGKQALWAGKQQSNATILKTIGSMAGMSSGYAGGVTGKATIARETMNPYRMSMSNTNVGVQKMTNPYARGWGG